MLGGGVPLAISSGSGEGAVRCPVPRQFFVFLISKWWVLCIRVVLFCTRLYMGTNNKKQMAGLFRESKFFHPQRATFTDVPPLPTPLPVCNPRWVLGYYREAKFDWKWNRCRVSAFTIQKRGQKPRWRSAVDVRRQKNTKTRFRELTVIKLMKRNVPIEFLTVLYRKLVVISCDACFKLQDVWSAVMR